MVCIKCGGRGYIVPIKCENGKIIDYIRETCSTCNGKGEVDK